MTINSTATLAKYGTAILTGEQTASEAAMAALKAVGWVSKDGQWTGVPEGESFTTLAIACHPSEYAYSTPQRRALVARQAGAGKADPMPTDESRYCLDVDKVSKRLTRAADEAGRKPAPRAKREGSPNAGTDKGQTPESAGAATVKAATPDETAVMVADWLKGLTEEVKAGSLPITPAHADRLKSAAAAFVAAITEATTAATAKPIPARRRSAAR